jgi:hypothetical protein
MQLRRATVLPIRGLGYLVVALFLLYLANVLERLSEKGASDALSVDVASIRRPKWAEKHRFGHP